MTLVQDIYESMFRDIEARLLPEGFERGGQDFRRRLPDGKLRWSIACQKSQYSTAERGKFTFWVHAEWKHRPAWYRDWEPKTAWYSGAGGRIGDIMPRKEDLWWEINELTSAPVLGGRINDVLSSYALPFLRRFQTEDDIKAHLRSLTNTSMKLNYPHALEMLKFDLLDGKDHAEIEAGVTRARNLGRINRVSQDVIEADIQRVRETNRWL